MVEILILYIVIGVFLSFRHIASGKVGEIGVLGTFFAHTLLWPIFLVMK